MSVWQTILVFAVIPLGVVGLITFAVYGKSLLHQPNRYRPGKRWGYAPAWFVPHPDAVVHGEPGRKAIEGASSTTAMGGASGEW